MTKRATGTFEVKVTPQTSSIDDPLYGRYSLEKLFHGDLEGTGKGEMMGAGNPASGNAGYVAIEKITGTLHGRSGSFALQHSSTLTGGVPHMAISVAPGSGTDDLAGISGTFTLEVAEGKHSYVLEYEVQD